MSTPYLTGTLVEVGNEPGAEPEQPRILIHCTREQIQAANHLPFSEPVAVVPVSELAVMTKERDQWHTHYRDERSRGLQLQDALGDEMKRLAELETDVANLKKDRDDILRQWREREPQLRAAETDLSELQVAYGVLKRHADAMAKSIEACIEWDWAIMGENCGAALAAYRASHHEKQQ
jgi:hypothetical protein